MKQLGFKDVQARASVLSNSFSRAATEPIRLRIGHHQFVMTPDEARDLAQQLVDAIDQSSGTNEEESS